MDKFGGTRDEEGGGWDRERHGVGRGWGGIGVGWGNPEMEPISSSFSPHKRHSLAEFVACSVPRHTKLGSLKPCSQPPCSNSTTTPLLTPIPSGKRSPPLPSTSNSTQTPPHIRTHTPSHMPGQTAGAEHKFWQFPKPNTCKKFAAFHTVCVDGTINMMLELTTMAKPDRNLNSIQKRNQSLSQNKVPLEGTLAPTFGPL